MDPEDVSDSAAERSVQIQCSPLLSTAKLPNPKHKPLPFPSPSPSHSPQAEIHDGNWELLKSMCETTFYSDGNWAEPPLEDDDTAINLMNDLRDLTGPHAGNTPYPNPIPSPTPNPNPVPNPDPSTATCLPKVCLPKYACQTRQGHRDVGKEIHCGICEIAAHTPG